MPWHEQMPMEYRNRVVVGDVRTLSEQMPNESVDIVFTSPPYNVGLDYGAWDDNLPNDAFWRFQREWLTATFRVATQKCRLYLIVGDEMLWRIRSIAEDVGWRFHQLLVWCKPNLVGGAGRISKDWNLLAEWCLLFHKGKRTPMQSGVATTFNWIVAASCQSNFLGSKRKIHPAQMALAVALAWLSRTPGQVVFEPFCGSGTTCQASRMLGKDYVAFEIDSATANLARRRTANAQPPLPKLVIEQMPLEP